MAVILFKIMRKYFDFVFILAFFFSLPACYQAFWTEEEDCEFADYSDCNSVKPTVAPLTLELTINEENPEVRVEIYDGNIVDDYKIHEFVADTSRVEVDVPVGAKYSAQAFYKFGDDSLTAVDGTNYRRTSYTYCDSTCWRLHGGSIDLELKDYDFKSN